MYSAALLRIARHRRKMLGRAEKTLSVEVKCLVGKKNVQHRRKMLGTVRKCLAAIAEKCLTKPRRARHTRKMVRRAEKGLYY